MENSTVHMTLSVHWTENNILINRSKMFYKQHNGCIIFIPD